LEVPERERESYAFFFLSAQRFFIISEMRLRASGDIWRRRLFRLG
jgi:hypothetical protein